MCTRRISVYDKLWTVTVHHASPDQPYGLEYDIHAPDEAAAYDAVVDIIGDVNYARAGRIDVEEARNG